MKRLIFLVVLLVLGGIGVSYLPLNVYDRPVTTFDASDGPKVKALKVVQIASDDNGIAVALEINKGASPEAFLNDILETYRWGNAKYGAHKCGKDYKPALCDMKRTMVVLVVTSEVPGVHGKAKVYMTAVVMGLDQVQTKLLLDNPPSTPTAVLSYHADVMKATMGTGGFIKQSEEPVVFTGLE